MEGIYISTKLFSAINKQAGFEIYSGYIYEAMALYCKMNNFKGMANWFNLQAKEEYEHADKMLEHLIDRGYKVTLPKIDEPPSNYKSVTAVFEKAYEHEKLVTSNIHKLYKMALADEDYPAQVMLQWFVKEQVEEEANTSEIVEKLKMINGNLGAIFMLDSHLGSRK
jgi:ferritin